KPFLQSFSKNMISGFQFNSGGPVPGVGNKDTVPAMLTPGEFVLNKNAVKRIGLANLKRLNTQYLNKCGLVKQIFGGGLGGASGHPATAAGIILGLNAVMNAFTGLTNQTVNLSGVLGSLLLQFTLFKNIL